MDWRFWDMEDGTYFLQWQIAIPNLLGNLCLPIIVVYFFCQYCGVSFKWRRGLCYAALYCCLFGAEMGWKMPGSLGLLLEICLLACFGRFGLKRKWGIAAAMAILILSVLSVTSSVVRWFDYRVAAPFVIRHTDWIPPSDAVRELVKVALAAGLFVLILHEFMPCMVVTGRLALLQLVIPALFIAMMERVLQDSVYGRGMVVDHESLEMIPDFQIHYGEILFLQVFAGLCLLAVLLVHQRIVKMLRSQERIRLLEQQTAAQEVYMQEAKARYGQTRSFRHDIRNHMTVLAELLKADRPGEALEYLSDMKAFLEGLSWPVQTGNAAVDALMGSKLSAARQRKIVFGCEIKLPEIEGMKDIDWCIVLANSMDNAIKACEACEEGERFIRLSGRQKGNLYLLSIENSCSREINKMPEEGIGLSNIRFVMEKQGGAMEKTVLEGIYRLNLLFVRTPSHIAGFACNTAANQKREEKF